MSRSGEEVKGENFLCHVSKLLEDHRIACERLRVAGDVNYALRGEGGGISDESFVASRSRWVEDDDVGRDLLAALGFGALKELFGVFGVTRVKFRVSYAVAFGVEFCTFNGGG